MSKEIKITKDSKKQELINFVTSFDPTNLAADVADRLNYTVLALKANSAKVEKSVLIELIEEITGATLASVPVEGSDKPKTDTATASDKKTEKVKPPKPAPKAKAPEVETVPPMTNVGVDNLPMAVMFPAVIDHDKLGKLEAAPGRFLTYEELVAAVQAEETIFVAAYWSKAQIKKFDYKAVYSVAAPKDGFPNDLDMLQIILTCDTVPRVFAMSVYTEAMYRIEGDDLARLEDEDPRNKGAKYSVRVSNGMEFEFYTPVAVK